VVLCAGLDTESELQFGIQVADDLTRQGFIDTTIKSSGTGSLRFTLRKGVTLSNIGGAWSKPLGRTFRSGDTIYVQWRQRISPEYVSNNRDYWTSSIKQINIHGPSSTCQGAELTTVYYAGGTTRDSMPSMYTNCGDGFNTDPTNNILCGTVGANCSGKILIQQGSSLTPSSNGNGYNCEYQNTVAGKGDGSGCFFPPASTWVTYYEKIKIGAFGGTDTAVDAYVAVNGGPYKQFQRASGIRFVSTLDNNFQLIRLETYMTELPKVGRAAPVDAYVWYDELIVSTQPIAAPGLSGIPAPRNLRF
jgi:hypothetical protein